jgi:membrane protease YdiL (CAAX protease family)
MLILSALVAGGFWGLLYAFGRNLAPLIVSHALFTAVIFTLAPIGQA